MNLFPLINFSNSGKFHKMHMKVTIFGKLSSCYAPSTSYMVMLLMTLGVKTNLYCQASIHTKLDWNLHLPFSTKHTHNIHIIDLILMHISLCELLTKHIFATWIYHNMTVFYPVIRYNTQSVLMPLLLFFFNNVNTFLLILINTFVFDRLYSAKLVNICSHVLPHIMICS